MRTSTRKDLSRSSSLLRAAENATSKLECHTRRVQDDGECACPLTSTTPTKGMPQVIVKIYDDPNLIGRFRGSIGFDCSHQCVRVPLVRTAEFERSTLYIRTQRPYERRFTNSFSDGPYNCRETQSIWNATYGHYHCMHKSFKGRAMNPTG